MPKPFSHIPLAATERANRIVAFVLRPMIDSYSASKGNLSIPLNNNTNNRHINTHTNKYPYSSQYHTHNTHSTHYSPYSSHSPYQSHSHTHTHTSVLQRQLLFQQQMQLRKQTLQRIPSAPDCTLVAERAHVYTGHIYLSPQHPRKRKNTWLTNYLNNNNNTNVSPHTDNVHLTKIEDSVMSSSDASAHKNMEDTFISQKQNNTSSSQTQKEKEENQLLLQANSSYSSSGGNNYLLSDTTNYGTLLTTQPITNSSSQIPLQPSQLLSSSSSSPPLLRPPALYSALSLRFRTKSATAIYCFPCFSDTSLSDEHTAENISSFFLRKVLRGKRNHGSSHSS